MYGNKGVVFMTVGQDKEQRNDDEVARQLQTSTEREKEKFFKKQTVRGAFDGVEQVPWV